MSQNLYLIYGESIMSNRLNVLILAAHLKGLKADEDGTLSIISEFVEKHGELLASRTCNELYTAIQEYLISWYTNERPMEYKLDKVVQLAYAIGTEV